MSKCLRGFASRSCTSLFHKSPSMFVACFFATVPVLRILTETVRHHSSGAMKLERCSLFFTVHAPACIVFVSLFFFKKKKPSSSSRVMSHAQSLLLDFPPLPRPPTRNFSTISLGNLAIHTFGQSGRFGPNNVLSQGTWIHLGSCWINGLHLGPKASRALEEDRAEGPWCTRGRIGDLSLVGTASGADDSEAELDFVRSAVDFVGLRAPRFKRDGRCQAEGFQCRDIAAEMVEEKTARSRER